MLVYQRVATKFFGYPILREIHELLVLSKLLGGTKKTHGIHHCPVHLPLKKNIFQNNDLLQILHNSREINPLIYRFTIKVLDQTNQIIYI